MEGSLRHPGKAWAAAEGEAWHSTETGPVKPKTGCFLPGTGVLFGELKTHCGSLGGPSNRVDEYEFLKIPSLPRGSL